MLAGEYSTLPRDQRKARKPVPRKRYGRLARSKLPKPTDLPDTALWERQLAELSGIDQSLQAPPPKYVPSSLPATR